MEPLPATDPRWNQALDEHAAATGVDLREVLLPSQFSVGLVKGRPEVLVNADGLRALAVVAPNPESSRFVEDLIAHRRTDVTSVHLDCPPSKRSVAPPSSRSGRESLGDSEPVGSFLVTGDDGSPIGMFDADMILTEGTRLAFAMAAVCDDNSAVEKVQADALARVGSTGFGYIAAAAMSVLVKEVLAPTLEVTRELGKDLRPGLRAIAAGEDPTGL